MEIYEILEKGLREIEHEQNWTQDATTALSAQGPNCAMTALKTAIFGTPIEILFASHYDLDIKDAYIRGASKALEQVASRRMGVPPEPIIVVEYNDTHTHSEVVSLYKEAIRDEKVKAGIDLGSPVDGAPVPGEIPVENVGPRHEEVPA